MVNTQKYMVMRIIVYEYICILNIYILKFKYWITINCQIIKILIFLTFKLELVIENNIRTIFIKSVLH